MRARGSSRARTHARTQHAGLATLSAVAARRVRGASLCAFGVEGGPAGAAQGRERPGGRWRRPRASSKAPTVSVPPSCVRACVHCAVCVRAVTHFCVVDPLTGYDVTDGASRSQDVIAAFGRAAALLDAQLQHHAQVGVGPAVRLVFVQSFRASAHSRAPGFIRRLAGLPG